MSRSGEPGADQHSETAVTALRLEGKPLATSYDVARYFDVPHARMIWVLYKADDNARYTQFELPKRSGGMRAIHAPLGLVRELQTKMLPDLKALYRPYPQAHGFIDGRGVASNAAEHVGKRWVLNIDLEDFFPTVNFGRVRGLFMKPPFDMGASAATVCARIVTHRNGLPQGAPTSPILSNFIAATLDRQLQRLARQNRLTYTRYADDITFSTNLPTFPPAIVTRRALQGGLLQVEAGDALTEAVSRSGFAINRAKVRLQGRYVRQSVTGLTVNERVNVARARIRKLRAILHAWRKFGIEAAAREHFYKYRSRSPKEQLQAGPSGFRNAVYGHLAFVKMVRGGDDPVFLKLCAQLLELDPKPSRFIRQMVFGADDYDVFISHASEDKANIARPIYEACERMGVKAFLDEAHIGFGQNFTDRINVALGAAPTVLVVVSSNSVSKDWPLAEINAALALEVSGAKQVIPLMVGNPDLSKLPLVRTKRWITWDGDAGEVVEALKGEIEARTASAPATGADAKSDRPAGFFSRLFRGGG